MQGHIFRGVGEHVIQAEDGAVEVRTSARGLWAIAVLTVLAFLFARIQEKNGGSYHAMLAEVTVCTFLVIAPMYFGRLGVELLGRSRGLLVRFDPQRRTVRWTGGLVPFDAVEDVVVCPVGLASLGVYLRTAAGPVPVVRPVPAGFAPRGEVMERITGRLGGVPVQKSLEQVAATLRAMIHAPRSDPDTASQPRPIIRRPEPLVAPEAAATAFLYVVFAVAIALIAPEFRVYLPQPVDSFFWFPPWVVPLVAAAYVIVFRRRGLQGRPLEGALQPGPRTPPMRRDPAAPAPRDATPRMSSPTPPARPAQR
jgi:hypothetical protein